MFHALGRISVVSGLRAWERIWASGLLYRGDLAADMEITCSCHSNLPRGFGSYFLKASIEERRFSDEIDVFPASGYLEHKIFWR